MGKFYFYILGIITGLANGLFGSGGGIIAVPMLKKSGLSTKEAHATSIALTLPLSIVSSIFYYNIIKDIFMKKIPSKYLKKAFGVILIISGVRLLCK